jgi:hypothetical protein
MPVHFVAVGHRPDNRLRDSWRLANTNVGQKIYQKAVNCSMAKEYKQYEHNVSMVHDDGPYTPWTWEPQEIAQLQEALKMTHTERFRLMTKLMRRGIMLKNAKITYQKV